MLEVDPTHANTGLMFDCWPFQGHQTWAKVLKTRVLLVYCLDVYPRAFYVAMRSARP
jgi:hypothetical protein